MGNVTDVEEVKSLEKKTEEVTIALAESVEALESLRKKNISVLPVECGRTSMELSEEKLLAKQPKKIIPVTTKRDFGAVIPPLNRSLNTKKSVKLVQERKASIEYRNEHIEHETKMARVALNRTTQNLIKEVNSVSKTSIAAVDAMFGIAASGAADDTQQVVGSSITGPAESVSFDDSASGSTGATGLTGTTGATGATGSPEGATGLSHRLDAAIDLVLRRSRSSIRRKSGPAVLAGLQRTADDDNRKAEEELSTALSADVAAQNAKRDAAKKRIVKHLLLLKDEQNRALKKTMVKLHSTQKSLENVTSLLTPLREKISSMKRALEFARESGMGGGSADRATIYPLEKKGKALSQMESKLTAILRSVAHVVSTQEDAVRVTEERIKATNGRTSASNSVNVASTTGATGAAQKADSTGSAERGMRLADKGKRSISSLAGPTGETGADGETGATGSIPDNIVTDTAQDETGTHESSFDIGSTGGSFGKTLTEQEREITFNNYVQGHSQNEKTN